MLKIFIFIALLTYAANGNPISTPLLGRLEPQPALAPANTEHAGYVGALTPILRSSAYALIPTTYTTAQHLPIYAGNYLTSYSAPIEASSYRIAY